MQINNSVLTLTQTFGEHLEGMAAQDKYSLLQLIAAIGAGNNSFPDDEEARSFDFGDGGSASQRYAEGNIHFECDDGLILNVLDGMNASERLDLAQFIVSCLR